MTDIVERLGNLNDALLACGSDYSDILLGAVNEFKQLRQQLAESQAREKVLRDTLENNKTYVGFAGVLKHDIAEALAMPSDSTALDAMLKQAKLEALIEAAEHFDRSAGCTNTVGCCTTLAALGLRRMAEELK
jgi:hypothetical protein